MPAFLQLREQTPKVGRRGTNLRTASATDCSRLDLWVPRPLNPKLPTWLEVYSLCTSHLKQPKPYHNRELSCKGFFGKWRVESLLSGRAQEASAVIGLLGGLVGLSKYT